MVKNFLVSYLRYIIFLVALVISITTNNCAFVLVVVIESIAVKIIGKIDIKKLFSRDREIFNNLIGFMFIVSFFLIIYFNRDIGQLLLMVTLLTLCSILLAMSEIVIKSSVKCALIPNKNISKSYKIARWILIVVLLIFTMALLMYTNGLIWKMLIKVLETSWIK